MSETPATMYYLAGFVLLILPATMLLWCVIIRQIRGEDDDL